MRNFRILWFRGVRWTTWTESRRAWGGPDTHMRVMRRPDGTDAYPDMDDPRIRRHARVIADSITDDARNSGPDPIAWVTGNAMMPPLRSFDLAEDVWQHPANHDGEAFAFLVETVESYLSDVDVALECPEYDNALYAVDLSRFQYIEGEDGETLQDDWQPVYADDGDPDDYEGEHATAHKLAADMNATDAIPGFDY